MKICHFKFFRGMLISQNYIDTYIENIIQTMDNVDSVELFTLNGRIINTEVKIGERTIRINNRL